jgi:hypothetical protein
MIEKRLITTENRPLNAVFWPCWPDMLTANKEVSNTNSDYERAAKLVYVLD